MVLLAVLGLVLFAIFGVLKARTAPKLANNESLVERVGRHVLLPDEIPTVATVSDINLLADQPFFARAKNGDKVLLFRASNRAILYDPRADKVLDIGNIDSVGPEGDQTESE